MKIVDVSIKRPVMIMVIVIALLVVGGLSYKSLTINDMPQADIPIISVSITDHGVSPDSMETKIAKKVEDAVGQVSGVKHITTNVGDGFCNLVIEFDLSKSGDVAAQEVKDKISGIRNSLPQEMDEPVVQKFDIGGAPILSLAVTGEMDSRALSKIVDDVITKQLYTVNGVGSVQVYGKEEHEVQIKIDLEKLAAYALTPTEMVMGVTNGNLEKPGGTIKNDGQEISLKTDNNVKTLNDFYNITVGTRAGHDIHVRDVAEVKDGIKDRDTLSFYDGKPAISLDVIKQSGANTVTVSDNVKARIALLQKYLPKSVHIEVIRDNSISIRDSVNDVVKTIIEGCILAVIIVFLFLAEWETTLISAISLPVSIITTFICMKVMNFSLNTMSLMALSLAVGLLIDDAIVVIENIVRHLHMGKGPLQAAKEATSEIGLAVLATTLSVVAVFIPIGMVSGIIGKFFIEFGLTVAFSMLVSLVISFTLVPMMSSRMLKISETSHKKPGLIGKGLHLFNLWFDKVGETYARILRRILKHRLITLVVMIMLFFGSIQLIPLLGFSFVPSTDNGQITVDTTMDAGQTIEARGEKAMQIEAVLKKYKEVSHLYTTVNSDGSSTFVELVEKQDRTKSSKEIAEAMRKDLLKIPGLELSVTAGSLGPSSGKDFSLILQGEDLKEIRKVANSAKAMLEKDPHARDVSINDKQGKLETKLIVDRDKAADLGIDVSLAADTLKALFDGIDAGKFDYAGDRYDVRISVKDDQRKSLDSINQIYVNDANRHQLPLSNVIRKELSTSEASIHRYDRMKQIEISANIHGMAPGDFLNKYMKEIQGEAAKSNGVVVRISGQNESMQEGFSSLVIALLMGIMFMYMIMAMQFESFLEPVSIMFALPMAVIGAIIGLYVAGSEMSIMSLIGIILLMGLVAKNGILLIDFAKQRQAEGESIVESLIDAGRIRLRPILMTTLAMIFGMIPVATATGSGTEMRAPMGHAVIGGLISSTLLTLFIVPVVYSLLRDLKAKTIGLAKPKANKK